MGEDHERRVAETGVRGVSLRNRCRVASRGSGTAEVVIDDGPPLIVVKDVAVAMANVEKPDKWGAIARLRVHRVCLPARAPHIPMWVGTGRLPGRRRRWHRSHVGRGVSDGAG